MNNVFEEDRTLVQNCIHILENIKPDKIFTTWACLKSTAPPGFYLVTSYLGTNCDFEFSTRELETVYDVNPARVVAVVTGRQDNVSYVQIKISDKNQPIVLNDTQIINVRKRSRWGSIK